MRKQDTEEERPPPAVYKEKAATLGSSASRHSTARTRRPESATHAPCTCDKETLLLVISAHYRIYPLRRKHLLYRDSEVQALEACTPVQRKHCTPPKPLHTAHSFSLQSSGATSMQEPATCSSHQEQITDAPLQRLATPVVRSPFPYGSGLYTVAIALLLTTSQHPRAYLWHTIVPPVLNASTSLSRQGTTL